MSSIQDLPHQHSRKREPPPIDWIKTQLSYDPETGELKWLVRNKGRTQGKVGGLGDGYVHVTITKEGVRHRLRRSRLAFSLMTNRWPRTVDHINGNRADDRWVNLREVGPGENERNKRVRATNKCGVNGVGWHPRTKTWIARVQSSERAVHLGYFKDFFEAVCARKSAEIKYGYHENHGRAAAQS